MIIIPNKPHRMNENPNGVDRNYAYHSRIRKKWLKRYGYRESRTGPEKYPSYYIMLPGFDLPIYEPNLFGWSVWYGKTRINKATIVQRTEVGELLVSTIFLSLDHGFLDNIPILYETMILNAEFEDQNMWRYETKEEALIGHKEAVRKAIRFINQKGK